MKAVRVPDFTTILGLVVGIGGIMAGLILEGGKISDLVQVTGAMIVLCGTIGAVMITTPPDVFMRAVKKIGLIFFEPRYSAAAGVAQMLGYSNQARRNGIVSLEREADRVDDVFLRKALMLAVDGTELHELRQTLELDMDLEEQRLRSEVKVYESAGGYSPTIGIIGAVLGLIQVMKNLSEIDKVGHGIAVAFVATVYGVALANLIFLPAAGKLRSRIEDVMLIRTLVLEGICGIVQGSHPNLIERRLAGFVSESELPAGRRASARATMAQGAA